LLSHKQIPKYFNIIENNGKDAMSYNAFPAKLILSLSVPRVLIVKNDKIFVFGPGPGPKITGPCDWNGTTQQNNSFSPAITAYSTLNDTTGTGKGTWIGKFSAPTGGDSHVFCRCKRLHEFSVADLSI
jgi:hypothetical protein